MKVIILFLFLLAFPFSISLAEEGTPCGGSGGGVSTTPSSEPSSTPSGDGGSNSVSDQIGLTYGHCSECGNPLGPDSYDPSNKICSYDCEPDKLGEQVLQGMDDMFSALEEGAHQVMSALANFPSYQYDASHASVPSPQGY